MPAASALRAEKAIAERSRGAHPCVAQLASSRLDESRCHSLPTLILPLVLALTLTASSFGHGLTLLLTTP